MIIIDDKVIDDAIINEHFLCNLKACKGACCWEGDFGAPLEESELEILEQILPKVTPFMTDRGIAAIEEKGVFEIDPESRIPGTTLIQNGACAFIHFDEIGGAHCGIEVAWKKGDIDFKKPISCHLYPIRVEQKDVFEKLSYDIWDICSDACTLGKKEQLTIYQFLKEPIIRKYGQGFYDQLEATAQFMKNK